MEAQHAQVDEHLGRLGPALDRWHPEARPAVTNEVADIIESLTEVLTVHLDEEEREACRWPPGTSPPRSGRSSASTVAARTRSELPLLVGAVLEGATRGGGAHRVQAAAAGPACRAPFR